MSQLQGRQNNMDKRNYEKIKGDQLDLDLTTENDQQQQNIQLEDQDEQQQYKQRNLVDYYPDSVSTASHFELSDSPHFFGKSIVFSLNSFNLPRFTLGPDWPMFICTLSAFAVADFFLIKMALQLENSTIWQIFTILICLVQILSYLITATLNPGIAHNKDMETQKIHQIKDSTVSKSERLCQTCQILMDSWTYHCEICDVCIRGYDHHCPFIGKCVGKRNMIYFKIFIASTLVFMVNGFILAITILLPLVHKPLRGQGQNNDYNSRIDNSS